MVRNKEGEQAGREMERSGEMVPFPLLMESSYRACTIPYRFPSDINPSKPTPTELSWIHVFMNSIPSFRYAEILDNFKKDPQSHGGPPDGILAELFSRDGISFLASCQNLAPRPWVVDALDTFITKWCRESWKKAVIFVDNSGADSILGILPFTRELLRHGTEVIDLTGISQELAYLASDADLVILEGMGRGMESNLYAQFRCDSLKIGMLMPSFSRYASQIHTNPSPLLV